MTWAELAEAVYAVYEQDNDEIFEYEVLFEAFDYPNFAPIEANGYVLNHNNRTITIINRTDP